MEQGLYADILLRLDQDMRHYRKVHAHLRPGGAWTTSGKRPQSQDEWIELEDYMGVFEHINFLVDQNLITIDYVERFYGYRYQNIVSNEAIVEAKLGEEFASWKDFVELGRKLDIYNGY